jgi:hypothetical protein
MGAATKHKKAFLLKHPYCAFCGGVAPATTVEHCPPRSLFQDRQWPEGFEFPCCEACNHGTSNEDLLVAMLGRLDPFTELGDRDGRQNGLMRAVSKQFPDLFPKLIPSTAREARSRDRKLGIKPASGRTHLETPVLSVPAEFHIAICTFGRKLAKAIFYRDSSTIFPSNGCLFLNWFSNEQLMLTGKYQMLELMRELDGVAPQLARSGRLLNDQFSFKLSMSPQKDTLVLQVVLGKSLGFVVFGSTRPGALEASYERLHREHGNGPFAVIASSVLNVQPDFGFSEHQVKRA